MRFPLLTTNFLARRTTTIEQFIASKDPWRAVAHGEPLLRYFYAERSNRYLQELYDVAVSPHLAETLSKYSITPSEVRLEFLYRRHSTTPGIETLVIIPQEENNTHWPSAAHAVWELFMEKGAGNIVPAVQVEIRNPQKMYSDVSRSLPNDDLLIDTLDSVSREVSNTVKSLMPEIWVSIGCRWKADDSGERGRPTIVVVCNPGSTFDFEAATNVILSLLEHTPMDIYLEFLPGSNAF